MPRRYLSLWFPHLTTDWHIRRRPALKDIPFVLAGAERGRMMVRAANRAALSSSIHTGMVIADCRAILPDLEVLDDDPDLATNILIKLAEWCIRYSPVVAVDGRDGLLLDISGCPHLWGGEHPYLADITTKLHNIGYNVRGAIADSIGAAWAISRYGQEKSIVAPGEHLEALLPLPAEALRLEAPTIDRLNKLGLYAIKNFVHIPGPTLRRRFGQALLTRLAQALGREIEAMKPVHPVQPYQERLPSQEPICTAIGIEIALKRLLKALCQRLSKEEKGIRKAIFRGYRNDGQMQQIEIGTSRASSNTAHLFRLFELKIATLEPDLGFELFFLEATLVEDMPAGQEALWAAEGTQDKDIAELLDRLGGKVGMHAIHRYLPQEHYWPERSFKEAGSLLEPLPTTWPADRLRPVHLLAKPERIEVTVPLPDYPPMLFKYKGSLHKVAKADGPERIEREWWLEGGAHRDYYCVEDETGSRYWLFRLGHYATGDPTWYVHGFFA